MVTTAEQSAIYAREIMRQQEVIDELTEALKGLLAHVWENRKRDVRKDYSLMVAEVAAQNAIIKARADETGHKFVEFVEREGLRDETIQRFEISFGAGSVHVINVESALDLAKRIYDLATEHGIDNEHATRRLYIRQLESRIEECVGILCR